MRVLAACEFSGIVRDAFTATGHDAWSCDLLPSERPGQHYQADVREGHLPRDCRQSTIDSRQSTVDFESEASKRPRSG
jgi:hypothetical protein